MNNQEYADKIMPNVLHDTDYYESLYKERILKEGAVVTRFAPSPTGKIHMGSLLAAFIAGKAAHDTDGIFFLRIEDTDQVREIENGIDDIINDLSLFDIKFSEGVIKENQEIGNYGPYIQSKRKDIYASFAKKLIIEDLAYPCFCTEGEIAEIRTIQEKNKKKIGYYGEYAKCRNLSKKEVIKKIENGEKYIIRLKSQGDFNKKIRIKDLVKGEIEFPENDLDIVIIKSDGLPTYHFAHAIDDHLMRTTHVIRGDEWLSSLPIHYDLFKTLKFKMPKYAHLSPLMKEDNGSKRKLSKRKDPEAAISYYFSKGIPVEAIKLYLMTIANTNFEDWYLQNKDKSIDDFKLSFNKISKSGSLFDLDKLINISKNYISRLTAEDVYNEALNYAKAYDLELFNLLNNNKDYTIKILSIERYLKKPRKDIAMYSEMKNYIWYFYPELFKECIYKNKVSKTDALLVKKYFEDIFNIEDSKDEWYNHIKDFSASLGYAKSIKEYNESPESFKGHIGDICGLIRYVITSLSETPDLYEILKVLGKEEIMNRVNALID